MTVTKPLHGVRVLLVEDDDDTRDLFSFALEGAGADVRAASDANEALVTVREWTPSVIVSDLALPTADGFSFLRDLRSRPEVANVPAIAVSGFASATDREAAIAAGFQAHAAKPIDPENLVALVRQWGSDGGAASAG